MRWLGRGLARAALGALLAMALYLAAAALGGLIPGRTAAITPAGPAEIEVGLLFGPIHVDFLLPATPETRDALAGFEAAGVPIDDPRVAHIIVGWGARDFYTTAGTYADITPRATLRAITGDASVLRADVLGPLSPSFNPPTLRLTEAQYSALLTAIAATATGQAIPEAGFTASDGFLEAQGRFHIFRTCNTWISNTLRAAGVPMGVWTPTPYAVRLSFNRFGSR